MTPRYVKPAAVAVVADELANDETGPTAYLALLPAGPIHAMDPIAYVIWSAAVDLGAQDAIVGDVAEITEEDPEAIRPHVIAFLDQLVSQGLLQLRPSGPTPATGQRRSSDITSLHA